MGISDKLLQLIGDESVQKWAEKHGLSKQTVHEWIKHNRTPGKSSLILLSQSTGKSIKWWLDQDEYASGDAPYIKNDNLHEGLTMQQNRAGYADKVVRIRRYVDIKGSAGPGRLIDSDGLIELVEFNAVALTAYIKVPPQYLVIAEVDGYSMEPFLFHGDQVFIDTRYQAFDGDGVYAIIYNSKLRFKRIRINFSDHTIAIKSDNDGGLGSETLTESQVSKLRIVGKVIPFKFGHFNL